MIFCSMFPSVEVPPIFADDEVLAGAGVQGRRIVMIDADSGRGLTGGQPVDGARRVAAGLAHGGFEPGNVLAVATANRGDFPVVVLKGRTRRSAPLPSTPSRDVLYVRSGS